VIGESLTLEKNKTKKTIETNECMSTTTETQFEDIKGAIRIRKLKKNR
jgi:hypothetical protein